MGGNKEIWLPLVPQPQEVLHFNCIGFQEVAIEVKVAGICSPAHFLLAILIDAIIRAKTLVTVNVENWNEKEGNVFKKVLKFSVNYNIAKKNQHPNPLVRQRVLPPSPAKQGCHFRELFPV